MKRVLEKTANLSAAFSDVTSLLLIASSIFLIASSILLISTSTAWIVKSLKNRAAWDNSANRVSLVIYATLVAYTHFTTETRQEVIKCITLEP